MGAVAGIRSLVRFAAKHVVRRTPAALALAAVLGALWAVPALSQPIPPPNPWVQSGNQVSYDGCVVVPAAVVGGCEGNGSLNVGSLFVGGAQLPSVAGTGISISGGVISVTYALSGNTTTLMTASGPFTNGHCLQADGNGNAIDSGGSCGGGGGSGTVNAGLANQLGYYVGAGNAISGLTTAANGVLVTSAGNVPSISSTLPAAVQGNITAVGTIASGAWHGTLIGVAYGGTQLSNPTAHSILQAEGTSALALITAATAGNFIVDQGSGSDWLSVAMSVDCTLAKTGAITCLKTNNVAFGTFATQNYATPPALGGTTPAAGTFTTLRANTSLTLAAITGSTQCLQVNSSGVVAGSGAGCGGATPAMGGRLVVSSSNSSCSGQPAVQTATISSTPSSRLCYVPWLAGTGNQVWINGTNYTYSLLSLDLTSSICGAGSSVCWVTQNIYDIYLVASGGNAVACFNGAQWATTTSTPAGRNITQNANGIYQNNATITDCYNGATDYGTGGVLTAGNATYIGTCWANANSTTKWVLNPPITAGGSNNILGCYNAYNRWLTVSREADSFTTPTEMTADGTVTYKTILGHTNNLFKWVDGLGLDWYYFQGSITFSPVGNTQTGGSALICIDWPNNVGGTCPANNGGTGSGSGPALLTQFGYGVWASGAGSASGGVPTWTAFQGVGLHTATYVVSIPSFNVNFYDSSSQGFFMQGNL